MTDTIYAAAYPIYHQLGWAPIKLKAGTKFPPPAGFTGHDGADPSYPDMMAWAEEEPGGNLAIRLPADVIGIDVDAYDNKTGATTIAEAEKRWGRLPYSPRSTSRNGDRISGIRLYRIPAGVELRDRIEFPELGIGDVEICQRHHRYVMCWPSIHAKTGRTYQWLGIDSTTLEPPYPADIPDLPPRWLEALTKPAHHDGAEVGSGEPPYNVRGALTEGEPTRRVAAKLGEAILACAGTSRHDHTRDNVLALLRYGKQGDTGVLPALKALQKVFVAAVGPDRPGGREQATEEFRDFAFSDRAAQLLAELDHDDDRGDGDQPEDNLETRIQWEVGRMRIRREAKRRLDDEENPPPALPPVRSLDALLAAPPAAIRYRVDQLAPAGGRVILSAQWKAGKTTLVGNLIRALADDTPFLGRFAVHDPACGIVLIDNELPDSLLHLWLTEQNISNTGAVADVVSLRGRLAAFNLLDPRCRTRWAQRLTDLGCDYLILDPLRPCLDALGLDENHDAGTFLTAFDALLTDAGVTDAAIVHHMGHNSERARGDSRLEDWPDAIWRMVREDHDDPNSARYFSAVGRDVNVAEGRLGYEPATRRLSYVAGSRSDAKAEAARGALIRLLADADEPPTSRGIEDSLGADHTRIAIRGAVAQCVGRGVIDVEIGPHGAKLHRITHPCAGCGLPVITGAGRHLSCPSSAEELTFD
jgi:hypothetical protein